MSLRLSGCVCCGQSLLKNPRLLCCLHAICDSCIEKTLGMNQFTIYHCSICKTDTKIEFEHKLPFDFIRAVEPIEEQTGSEYKDICDECGYVNNQEAISYCTTCRTFLCDIHSAGHSRSQRTQTHSLINAKQLRQPKSQQQFVCLPHESKEIRFFCEVCLVPLCRDCAIGDHKGHSFVPLIEALNRFRMKLNEQVDLIKQQTIAVEKSQIECQKMLDKINERHSCYEQRIDEEFESLINQLKQRQTMIHCQLNEIVEHKRRVLNEQIDKGRVDLLSKRMVAEYLEQITTNDSNIQMQFLSMQKVIYERIDQVNGGDGDGGGGDWVKFEPKEDDDFEVNFQSNSVHMFERICKQFGNVENLTNIAYAPNCRVTGKAIEGAITVGSFVTFLIETRTRSNERCQVGGADLVAVYRLGAAAGVGGGVGSNSETIDDFENVLKAASRKSEIALSDGWYTTRIVDNTDGTYVVSFRPRKAGTYSVYLSINNRFIQSMPYLVRVYEGRDYSVLSNFTCRSFALRGQAAIKFNYPRGCTIDSQMNQLLVSDNHRIGVYRTDGSLINTYGSFGSAHGQLSYPFGVAVSRDGSVIVCDNSNHRLVNFSNNGEVIRTIGIRGRLDGQFQFPKAICLDRSGRIAISDASGVQLFSEDGAFVGRLGAKTHNQKMDFLSPVVGGIATTQNGNFVVCDVGNGQLAIFANDNKVVSRIGKKGKDDGMFSAEFGMNVTVDLNDRLIVSDDGAHRIQFFDIDGSFISKIGSEGAGRGQFSHPHGICTDRHGQVFVCDWGNNRLEII